MRLLTVVLACAVLAGCEYEPLPVDQDQTFDEMIVSAIWEAEHNGAGEAQLALLREAQSEGKVTFEEAKTAAHAVVDCIDAAGSQGFYEEKVNGSGLLVPEYYSLANTDEQTAIADACDTQEGFWVVTIYQMQPSSQEMRDAYLEQQAPLLRACLEDAGYATDPDDTAYDLARQAKQALIDTDGDVNCYGEANLDGF